MQPVFGRGLWQDFLKCRFLFLCIKHPKFKCFFLLSNQKHLSQKVVFQMEWNLQLFVYFQRIAILHNLSQQLLLNSSFKVRNYFQLKWYKPKTNQIQHIPMVRYDLVGIAGFVCALNAHTTDLNIWDSATLSLPLSLCVLAIPETRF